MLQRPRGSKRASVAGLGLWQAASCEPQGRPHDAGRHGRTAGCAEVVWCAGTGRAGAVQAGASFARRA
eukprot:11163645-Lingulodinium_polyedra.AAC.1